MRIPEAKIEEIRSAADIVDVVGDYVRLKPSGSDYKGLCPFHDEKTPSFHVDPAKSLFYCFGCSKGGDLFSFVEEMEGVGFTESVRMLAERFGVTLPVEDGPSEDAGERESIYRALRFAARFFYRQLTQTEAGQPALRYLRGRGMTPRTIKRFGLGYAPDHWEALLEAAAAEHMAPDLLEKAGLVIARKSGDGYYDRYRGRVIFPLFSHVGKVLGFAGRILDADTDQPKYINSPETKVYHKSRVLYGLHQAKRAIRKSKEVFLVEGYTDVILLHQNGHENAVASCGTSLAAGHVEALDRYADRVLLLYDPDSAGVRATIQAINMVLEHGMVPYVISIPGGADPADLLQEEERDVTRRDFVKFRYLHARESGALDTPEGEAEAMRAVVDSIARMPDTLTQETYLRRASEVLDVPRGRLHEVLADMQRARRREQERSERRASPSRAPRPAAPKEHAPTKASSEKTLGEGPAPPGKATDAPTEAPPKRPLPQEEILLRLMLEHGTPMVRLILGHMGMDEFTGGPPRQMAAALLEMYHAGAVQPQEILDGSAGRALQQLGASVMVDQFEPSENWQRRNVNVPRMNADAREAAASAMTLLKLRRVDEAIRHCKEKQFRVQDNDEAQRQAQQQLMDLHALRKQIERREYLDA